MVGTKLTAANLSGANLGGVNLYGADLDYAKLYEANFQNAFLFNANFRHAKHNGTPWESASRCATILPDGTVSNKHCTDQ